MPDTLSRRSILSVLAGAVAPSITVRARPTDNERPSASLPHSEEFLLPSPQGKKYRIRIAYPHKVDPDLPLMIRGAKPSPLYVLDGSEFFGAVVSLARMMQWGGELPPCLVVGIGYDDEDEAERLESRSYDLTPSADPGLTDDYHKAAMTKYGGSAGFREFIVETLKPLIEGRIEVNHEASVLIGHSFSGLFALDTLVQQPKAFSHYLAMSPSLWFDHERVLRELKAALEAGAKFPNRVAVYVGEREERISPPKTHMTSNVLELARLVAQYRAQFSDVQIRVLPKTSHHNIIGPALALGLQFLISPAERRSEEF